MSVGDSAMAEIRWLKLLPSEALAATQLRPWLLVRHSRDPPAYRRSGARSSSTNGMMKMVPITGGVDVPKGGEVKFAPGGKHVMLFDINPAVKPGAKMTLVFTYADGTKIEAQADAKAAGEGGGAHDSH